MTRLIEAMSGEELIGLGAAALRVMPKATRIEAVADLLRRAGAVELAQVVMAERT